MLPCVRSTGTSQRYRRRKVAEGLEQASRSYRKGAGQAVGKLRGGWGGIPLPILLDPPHSPHMAGDTHGSSERSHDLPKATFKWRV